MCRTPSGTLPACPSTGIVHWRLDQSRDDVLLDGAGELQSGGLGEGSRHAGLQEPERRPDPGQLLLLSSVLVGEDLEAHIQTGAAAAAQQVAGSDTHSVVAE